MGFPKINIIFKSVASTAVKRGNKGIVLAILKDAANVAGNYEILTAADIPAGLSAYNKAQLNLIFQGGQTAPKKVLAVVQDSAALDIAASLEYAEKVKFDYLCMPGATEAEALQIANSVKAMRSNMEKGVKAVLPNTAADSEAVINFVTDDIVVGTTTYNTADYCARIAGLLAGTPLTESVTFTQLPDVDDVPRMSQDNAATLIDAGKFTLYHDGEKVKVARAVNSLVTTGTEKGDLFKKIKIVDILDTMRQDIRMTAEDSYIGKVANSYANKCLLVNAINAYFRQLEVEGLLEAGSNKCSIDVVATSNYLKALGKDVDAMDEAKIKVENTGDKVFLAAVVKPVDAMEEITFNVTL